MKRTRLSLEEKLRALDILEQGGTTSDIVRTFKVSRRFVRNLKKKKNDDSNAKPNNKEHAQA